MGAYPVEQHLKYCAASRMCQHTRDWMEKSDMKMLPDEIPELDELHIW
jgi:hypothetical protein